MASPELQKFIRAVSASPHIQEKLKAAADAEAHAIAEIAREAGFDVTVEDFMGHNQWWENLSF
ncbi:MAG: Nif11-like leader peptide family RiPP precursor [Synechococcus sp.]